MEAYGENAQAVGLHVTVYSNDYDFFLALYCRSSVLASVAHQGCSYPEGVFEIVGWS